MAASQRSEKGSLGLLLPKSQHKKDYDIATTRNNLFAMMTLHHLRCSGGFFFMQMLNVPILISEIISSYIYLFFKMFCVCVV